MIPIVEIIRLEEDFQFGTFGQLRLQKKVFCATLEPPDQENIQNISSIPAQQYMCKRIVSPKYGDCFEVQNVPGRSHILFHAGNIVRHTEGCIILGQYIDKLKDDRAVLNSGATYSKFMFALEGYDEFSLTVKEVY